MKITPSMTRGVECGRDNSRPSKRPLGSRRLHESRFRAARSSHLRSPDLGRVSEARCGETLVRAELWVAGAGVREASACQTLEPLGLIQRACLWLEGGAGLSVAEIGWICESDAAAVRRTLDEGGPASVVSRERSLMISSPFDALDRVEL